MSKHVVIIGTGSHARKLWLYLKLKNLHVRAFVDENPFAISLSPDIECLHLDQLEKLEIDLEFIVAIGNPAVRKRLQEKFCNYGWVPMVLVHPTAYVAQDAKIGAGSVICAQAVVETGSIIGDGCIVDIGVSVDHDCFINQYCHLKGRDVFPPHSQIFQSE